MKTIKIFLMLIMVLLVSVIACKKEAETPTPTPTPTVNPTDQLFSDNIADAIQSSAVDVSTWVSINGNKGTQIWMGPNSFVDANGNPVTGSVDFELIEALDNKDMLMLNRPTVTNNGELLISGGIIYINATQNSEQLQIAEPLATTMPTMGGNASSPFLLFSGDTTANGDFVWVEDTVNTLDWDTLGWYFDVDTIGWTNLDVLADLGQGVTNNVSVVLPSGLNGDNSAVMMYFTSMNSFMKISDGNADGTFTPGTYYTIPIGTTPKFVVVSMVNNDWSYHVSPSISIADPTDYIVPALTSVTDEEAAQTAILNEL